MNARGRAAISEVSRLRRLGLVDQAAAKLSGLLQGPSANDLDGSALVEALKLSLLGQRNDQAHNIYQQLRSINQAATLWEAEFLTRLSIATGREIPEAQEAPLGLGESWVRAYRSQGVDPISPVRILNHSVDCPHEAAVFSFQGECTSCGAPYEFQVSTTLTIERRVLCPTCLASLRIDCDSITTFLSNSYRHSLSSWVPEVDVRMNDLFLRCSNDAIEGDNFSLLSRYLGHDYLVLVNQYLLERLSPMMEGNAR